MGARKREALEQFNRDNILSAAKALFDSKGVELTTMDDIAEMADYSKSTIYVYFKSKEDIYNSIVQDEVELLLYELSKNIEEGKDFEDSYYRLCNCLVAFEERYPKYYASLVGVVNITNSRKKMMLAGPDINQGINALILKLLEKGKEYKVLRSELELQPTVLYFWSAISGIIQVAERKKELIQKNYRMTKQEYLRYSFRTFYESLALR